MASGLTLLDQNSSPQELSMLARAVRTGSFAGLLLTMLLATAAQPASPATQPADKTICTIALLADPHISTQALYTQYVKNFARVINQVNQANVDAVLIAGDLTQSFNPAAADKFVRMRSALHARSWIVPGNHDIGDKPRPPKPATVTEARLSQFEKAIGPWLFSEQITPQVRVIGITSSLFDTNLPSEQAQWEFLQRELDHPRTGITLLLSHYPPFTATPDEADGYFNINAVVRPRLLELLKRGGVTAVLSGHLHRPISLKWKGIPIIGAPAISFGLPQGQQQVGWTLVSIHADGAVRSELKYLPLSAAAPQPASAPAELLHATTAPTTQAAADHAGAVSHRVHIFYYDWYGAPPFQNGYVHWQQGGHQPPEDIGSNFFPALGAYSSADPAVLKQHMVWIRRAHAGVLVLTWWGQNSYEDRRAQAVLDAAADAELKVAFHLEPYDGRTPERVVDDVIYLLKKYGTHPAFYRARSQGAKPVFYVFETLRYPAAQWRAAIDRLRASAGEPLLIIAQTTDLDFVRAGGFDGGYPYDVLAPFKDPGFLQSWHKLATDFAAAGKLFIPSVGPGYWDDRAVPHGGAHEPLAARTRDNGQASTYDAAWRAAIQSNPPFITITSFNEWHEGTQIEPAIDKTISGYEYPADPEGQMRYIDATASWVDQFAPGD